MKKFLRVLLVILLVIALAAAGVCGYLWYRSNHIFVDDAVYPINSVSLDLRGQDISLEHYLSVHSQLPDCEILWDVPFQGGKYASNSESLTVSSLSAEDMTMLEYFPDLKTLDATGCESYDLLNSFQSLRPDCQVIYQVNLGGKSFDLDTAELVLNNGDYSYYALLENLVYLPEVTSVTLKMPELSLEQVDALRAAYENIAIQCTVELLGAEYDTQTTELDLSALMSDGVAEVAEKLAMLPELAAVELVNGDGVSQLTMEDVKALQTAAPDAVFHYTFDFYGVTISTTDEEVKIANKYIGNKENGEADLRLALDIMENCNRFVLDNCHFTDETMAQIREDYRDKTKIVWRVWFGENGSSLTDAEVIRAVYGLTDDNSTDLIYCEDCRFMDIGHNEFLDYVPFVAGMPNLEVIIISGAPVKDLEPFKNCKKLRVLEAAFCEYLTDASPLAECESLEMLNISYTHITDLSPLDNLNLTNLCAMYPGKSRVPTEEQERFAALKSDCELHWIGDQPYGSVWRYDDNNDKREWYAEICDAFGYPDPYNNVGWYLD